jgi:hypothetical protein
MSSNQNLDSNLTYGSIWLRANGTQAKFLFLTNQSLTAATQIKHPPQVVYADADGNIFNRDVDDFFRIYTFLNVDGDLEKRLESLLVFNASDYSTVVDADDAEQETPDPVADEPEEQEEAEGEPEETLADQLYRELVSEPDEKEKEKALQVSFGLSDHAGVATPVLTSADLSQALIMYSREPNANYDLTQHRLTFKLGGKVTLDSLREVFHPSKTVNTVDYFEITTRYGIDVVVWDSWIGIQPEYTVRGLYAAVYVGTTDAPTDTEETPGVEAVEVEHQTPAQQATQETNIPDMSFLRDIIQGSGSVTVAPGIMLNVETGGVIPTQPQPTYATEPAPNLNEAPATLFIPQMSVVTEPAAPLTETVTINPFLQHPDGTLKTTEEVIAALQAAGTPVPSQTATIGLTPQEPTVFTNAPQEPEQVYVNAPATAELVQAVTPEPAPLPVVEVVQPVVVTTGPQ